MHVADPFGPDIVGDFNQAGGDRIRVQAVRIPEGFEPVVINGDRSVEGVVGIAVTAADGGGAQLRINTAGDRHTLILRGVDHTAITTAVASDWFERVDVADLNALFAPVPDVM